MLTFRTITTTTAAAATTVLPVAVAAAALCRCHRQRRHVAQQATIATLRDELEAAKRSGAAQKRTDHVPGLRVEQLMSTTTTSRCLANSSQASDDDIGIKMVADDLAGLNRNIQRKEMSIKTLQDKCNQSQKVIRDYKVKLGLPTSASNEEVERKILEMKSQNVQLRNLKTGIRKEMDRSAALGRELKNSSQSLEHLRIRLDQTQLQLKQTNLEKCLGMERGSVHVVNLPQPSQNVKQSLPIQQSQPMKQCQECNKPIQPVLLCDLCNTRRLKLK